MVRRHLLAPLRHSLQVGYDGRTWMLPGEKLMVRADIDGAVEEAIAASQEGGLPTRLVRYVSGGEVDKPVSAELSYSRPAINRFVRRVAEEIDREPENASVEPDRRLARNRRRQGRAQAARQPADRGTRKRRPQRRRPACHRRQGPLDPARR